MSRATTYVLYVAMALACLLHFVAQRQGVHIPLVHAYMDDLFCIPLILFPLLLLFRRWLGFGYVFPMEYLLLTWVGFCVLFEGIVPLRNPNFTADAWDMLFYGLGTALFALMQSAFARPVELGKV